MSRYLLERMTFTADGTLGGLWNVNLDPNFEAFLDAGGGELDPTQRALLSSRPIIRGQTRDLGVLLAAAFDTGGSGHSMPYITIDGTNECTIYLQIVGPNATRGTASQNLSWYINKGVLVVTRVSGRPVLADFEIYADFDGTNIPVVRNTAVSLPGNGSAQATALWKLAGITTGGTVLYRISDDWSLDFGININRAPTQEAYSEDSALDYFAPSATFATGDCDVALTECGFAGAAVASGGMEFVFGQLDPTAVGLKSTGAVALVFRAGSQWKPNRLQLRGGESPGPALVEFEVRGVGADTITLADPPLTYDDDATMPATGAAEQFVAGPIYVHTPVRDFEGAVLDFGINWDRPDHSAHIPWPTLQTIVQRTPSVRISTRDLNYYNTLNNGKAISTSVRMYLRAMNSDGFAYANSEAQHVKLSLLNGYIEPGTAGLNHPEKGQADVLVTAVKDVDTGNFFAIAINQAIA